MRTLLILLFAGSLSAQISTYPQAGGGGGTPGGASGAVQFNNAGALGGDANHMWYPLAGTPSPSGGTGLVVQNGTDTEGWAWGTLFNSVAYLDQADIGGPPFNVVTIVNTTTDATSGTSPAYSSSYLELNGTHNYSFPESYKAQVNATASGTYTGAAAISASANLYSGTQVGSGNPLLDSVYSGLVSLTATTIMGGTGTAARALGVRSWVAITTGSTVTDAFAFEAIPPNVDVSLGMGTLTGINAAWHNRNFAGNFGIGKDFAWYSEGGTNHAETGAATAVGFEIEAFTAQTADLFRTIASDEVTMLPFHVDANGVPGSLGRTLAQLNALSPALTNGAAPYCSDCTVTSGIDDTCASGGSGASVVRVNGVLRCRI